MNGPDCSIPGCQRPVRARGWCSTHHSQWRRTGDPLGSTRPSISARFWAKVDLAGPVPVMRPDLGPCHIWTASLDKRGYGQFQMNHRMRKAHQVAFELAGETIPDGLVPDHLCRVTACVRRSHLEAVTHRENFLRSMHPTAVTVRTNQCQRGHELTPANTIRKPDGRRQCRRCANDRQRINRIRRGAA
jgi:hypothetical protein